MKPDTSTAVFSQIGLNGQQINLTKLNSTTGAIYIVTPGIAYAIWGLRKTRYEVTPEGYFFTPNARLGMLVAMLFVGRIIYVGLEIFVNQGTANALPRFTDSPLTLICLGVFAGYFGAYSAGLLRWRHAMKKAAASE